MCVCESDIFDRTLNDQIVLTSIVFQYTIRIVLVVKEFNRRECEVRGVFVNLFIESKLLLIHFKLRPVLSATIIHDKKRKESEKC